MENSYHSATHKIPNCISFVTSTDIHIRSNTFLSSTISCYQCSKIYTGFLISEWITNTMPKYIFRFLTVFVNSTKALVNFEVDTKLCSPCCQWIEHASTLWQQVVWQLQSTTFLPSNRQLWNRQFVANSKVA